MKKYIISNETEINEQNVKTWIDDFVTNIQPRLVYLDSFYQGEDDIMKYPYEKRDINSQIHVNLAYMTVQNIVSYCFGKEPTQDYHKDFKFGRYIDELKFKNNEILEDKALESDCSRLGLAYEFIGVREVKGIKEPFYKRIDPFTTFLVADDSILENEVCYITYSVIKPKNKAAYKKGFIYGRGIIVEFEYKSSRVVFTSKEDNAAYPYDFPIVMYKNNDNNFGDYEPACPILSAYSKTYSLGLDDFSGIANAILAFFNVDLPDEEREKLNRTRVVSLMGENSDAKYIYKKLDSSSFKALQEALRGEYYAITNVPDFTDLASYNKSGSAIAFKMIGIENIRLNKTAYFEQGMRKRWNIIASYVGKPFEIQKGDMEYHFYNNLPGNVSADLEYAELVEKGLMSKETALKNMQTISDVDGELKRIEAEARKRVIDTIKDMADINTSNANTASEKANPSYEFTMS